MSLGCSLLSLVAASTCFAMPPLRVCAAADNLPYSNRARQGFENELARLVAQDLRRPLDYVWLGQKGSELSSKMSSGACDVVMGIATGVSFVATTQPYYRSTFVWVSRKDRGLHIQSLDDPTLKRLKIGVHYLGEDNSEIPPVRALAKRGLMSNVVGFRIQGNYSQGNQAGELIRALETGKIDVAIAWGPIAGYFANASKRPLVVAPIVPDGDGPLLPFSFEIAMGVRRNDPALRDSLNRILKRHRSEISKLLARYQVPVTASRLARISGD